MVEYSKSQVVWKVLDELAQSLPDKTCFVYGDKEFSFKEMNQASDRLASGLLKLGFKKGDRIGIIGLNQIEWLLTYFAAAKIGVVITGLSVRYRDTELDYILNQSETRGLVTLNSIGDMDYVQFFQNFKSRIPSVTEYIFIGGQGFEGSHDFSSVMDTEVDEAALDAAKAAVEPDDLMIIIYTSGTTGRPKGAGISHKSQLAAARAQAEHTKISEDEMVLLGLPFNHVGGITCGILTTMFGGGTTVLIPMFDPNYVIELSQKYQPTIIPGVPTMHTLMLMSDNIGSFRTEKVRLVISGGSNSEPALLTALNKTYPNALVMNLYGLSESSGAVVLSPWESDFDTTIKSIGKPIGDFQVRIMDEEGKELPANETGELYFKGDAVVGGYFRMPEETSETFDQDGWLHTGDMGYLDDNGYIVLMGRKKEMYLQGGFNVYPVEVENLLSKHPKVSMVAGIGVPDPVLGEVGRYYIVPAPGESPTEEELKAYCKEKLADYKVPRQIVIRSELPLTPVGKIMKAQLKEEYMASGE